MEWGEKLHLEECTVPGPSLYTTVVVLVFLGAVLDEKFAKQNGHFEEILYSNVLVKYYGIQWLLEEKIFLKKPPLMAVNFKFMT